MAPTTAAERQRKYRAHLKSDPERREKYLQSESERWRKNVAAAETKNVESSLQKEQGEESSAQEHMHSFTQSRSGRSQSSLSSQDLQD